MLRGRPIDAWVSELERSKPEEILRRVEDGWIDLWCLAPKDLLRALLARCPADLLRARPVARWLAVDTGLLDGPEARALADRAMTQARGNGQPGQLLMAHLLLAARYGADDRLDRAREVLDGVWATFGTARVVDGAEDESDLVCFVYLQRGLLALLGGDVAGARVLAQSAYDTVESDRPSTLHWCATAFLALMCAVAGELRSAQMLLADLDPAAPSSGEPGGFASDAAFLARTILLIDAWNLRTVDRLIRSRKPASYGSLWPIAFWLQSQFLLLTGRYDQGLRLVDQAERSDAPGIRVPGLARDVVRAARADFNIAQGGLREAWIAIDPGRPRGVWAAVSEATVLYVSGEFETVRYAARVARTANDLTLREQVRLRGIEAAAALGAGDEFASARLLQSLVQAAESQGWRSYVAHLPRPLIKAAVADQRLPRGGEDLLVHEGLWVPGPMLAAPLSPREREIFRLVVDGLARQEIATHLGVSINTIKTQLRSLYTKLGVASRAELIRKVALMPPAWTYDVPD